MNIFIDTFSTPFGLFSTAVDATGAILATAFGDSAALRRRLAKCHGFNDTLPRPFRREPNSERARCSDKCQLIVDTFAGRATREQVLAYGAGERRAFSLRLAPRGTEFQLRVWAALARIPFGETRSYGQLAEQLGNPAASRAIGRANATNPICLIVPCHRVIGADGSLTGFAFGEEIKRRLLEHERMLVTRSRAA